MNWGSDFFGAGIRMNWKTYECFGRHTNELGFNFFLEDIRMNWNTDEGIEMQSFFWRTYE